MECLLSCLAVGRYANELGVLFVDSLNGVPDGTRLFGASGGIGAATARRFLEGNWQVGLFARREPALADVGSGRKNAHVFPGDVTDRESLEHAIATLTDRTGRLDVLFNNAGVFTPIRGTSRSGNSSGRPRSRSMMRLSAVMCRGF